MSSRRHGTRPFHHAVADVILRPGKEAWQRGRVYNPAAMVVRNRVALLYRAQGTERTRVRRSVHWVSVIGLAWSTDGVHFTAEPRPVFSPLQAWERAAVEDPRIVRRGTRFIMSYTASDGTRARLAFATTTDARLHRWSERFLVFPHERRWTKAGALLAAPLRGVSYVYFQMHERNAPPKETHIWVATSRNLREWTIVPRPVLTARRGHFDDLLVEPGPPPLLLPEGILLIYNAAKSSRNAAGRTFAVGWALFDRHDPTQVIERCEEPLLQIEHGSERRGRVPNIPFKEELVRHGRVPGTIFAEGLVYFRGAWRLYYGMGDAVIGVASARGKTLFSKTLNGRSSPRGKERASRRVFFAEDEPEHIHGSA